MGQVFPRAVRSPFYPCGCGEAQYAFANGIDNTGGFDRVTIKNGTVTGFEYGVRAVNADRLTVRGVRNPTVDGPFDIFMENSDNGVVRDILGMIGVSRNSDGNLLDGVARNVSVAGSRNTIRNSPGTIDVTGDGNTIEQNRVATFKAYVISGRGNVVRDNKIDAAEGVWLEGATQTLVEGNTITGTGDTTYAIAVLGSDRNTIRRNVLRGPRLSSAGEVSFKGGIGLCQASENTIERNDITNGFVGIGLGVDSGCPVRGLDGPLRGNVIRANTISNGEGDGSYPESTGDGIDVGPLATNTLIEGNTLLRNSDDGIDIQNPTTIVRKNVANLNGDLGIEALGGAVNGGGNVAHANGNPAQCTGIVCR